MAMTRAAPSRYALLMANSPTGPHPQTATVSPGLMSQFSAAMYPVGKMSVRNRTFSSGRWSGTLRAPTSANGTRTYSACPPAYPPYMCEYPNSPDPEYPYTVSAILAFGFELSHGLQRALWQKKHPPQAMLN